MYFKHSKNIFQTEFLIYFEGFKKKKSLLIAETEINSATNNILKKNLEMFIWP
jgi:hypothetical protein